MRSAVVCLLIFVMVSFANERARALPPVEKCGVMHRVEGKETVVALPSLHVIEATADGAFVLPKDAPPHVSAIQCGRLSLVPAKNDFKVLQAGFLFMIVAPDDRIAAMELSNGQLQYRTIKGEFASDEIPQIQEFLNVNQNAFYKPSAR